MSHVVLVSSLINLMTSPSLLGELSEPSIQGSGGGALTAAAAAPLSALALVAAVLFQFTQR